MNVEQGIQNIRDWMALVKDNLNPESESGDSSQKPPDELTQLSLSSMPTRGRVILVRGRALASEWYDRGGEYNSAREVLVEREDVERMLTATHRLPEKDDELDLLEAVLWFSLLVSISEHRYGETERASVETYALSQKIELLLNQAYNGNDRAVPRLKHLRYRTYYAYARHLQTAGMAELSERFFDRALKYCAESLELSPPERYDLEMRRYNFWSGMALIGLARKSLDTGELTRADRQLLVARSLLLQVHAGIEIAFIDVLLACSGRQQGRTGEAIDLLKRSKEKFRARSHERYFRRANVELVKAYLNVADYAQAEAALADEGPSGDRFSGDEKTQARWFATNDLLRARIELGLVRLESAERLANECLSALEDQGHSSDLRALGYAVLAEVSLSRKRYSDAIGRCRAGLALNPRDLNDKAWLTLVLAHGFLLRGHLESAKLHFSEWNDMKDRVENRFIHDRAKQFESQIEFERDSFYIPYVDPTDINYGNLNLRLRAFLARYVHEKYKGETQEQLAARLGVTRATYASWLAELRRLDMIDF